MTPARRRLLGLLGAVAAGLLLRPPATPAFADEEPPPPDLVVELAVDADADDLDEVEDAVELAGWTVAARADGVDGVLGGLLLVRADASDAATASALETTLEALAVVAHVEENVGCSADGTYGAEQSHVPVFLDEVTLSVMVDQDAYLDAGLGPPPSATGNPAVVVAVLDGGFELGIEALDGRCATGVDAIDSDEDPEDAGDGVDGDGDGDADDGVGHGSAVAALIAVAAPECVIFPVRVLDDEGVGTSFHVAWGIRAALNAGASVINLSVGTGIASTAVDNALASARDEDVLVVAASGNNADEVVVYPASSADALAVTGVDEDDLRDPDASVGAEVDASARSIEVIAPYPGTNDGYGWWYGTSMSCALFSAAAARVLQQDGGSPRGVGQDLLDVARAYPAAAEPWIEEMGAGVLDASSLLDD